MSKSTPIKQSKLLDLALKHKVPYRALLGLVAAGIKPEKAVVRLEREINKAREKKFEW